MINPIKTVGLRAIFHKGNSAFVKFASWYSDLKIVGINTDLLSFH